MAYRTDPRLAQPGVAVGATDEGLRSYMLSVYNYMGLGAGDHRPRGVRRRLDPGTLRADLRHAAEVGGDAGPAGLRVLPGRPDPVDEHRAPRRSRSGLFAAVMGLSMASIFLIYTGESIARVFFITAATFGAVSLYGYTTKRDLSGHGLVPVHGPDRHHHREPGQHLPGQLGAAVRGQRDRRAGVHRPHRLGHAAAEGGVSGRLCQRRRRHGRPRVRSWARSACT